MNDETPRIEDPGSERPRSERVRAGRPGRRPGGCCAPPATASSSASPADSAATSASIRSSSGSASGSRSCSVGSAPWPTCCSPIFVPTDGEPDRAQRLGGRLQSLGFWRGAGMVALAALALAGLLGPRRRGGVRGGRSAGASRSRSLVIAIGAPARARRPAGRRPLADRARRWPWRSGAGVAAASDLDFRGGIGKREYHPLTVRAIPADGYRLGIGRLDVDLRDLDWGKRAGGQAAGRARGRPGERLRALLGLRLRPDPRRRRRERGRRRAERRARRRPRRRRRHRRDPAARDRRERPARASCG